VTAGITASRLELLARCPTAAALPAVWTESTDDQVAGTGRHRYLERAPLVGRDAALAEIPADASWRATCEAIDVSEVPQGTAEIAYAYDVATDTARGLGQWLGRAYVVGPTEVSGTADLVCPPTAERPRWLVVDWKGDEEVERAATNIQLGLYGLAVARVHGLDEIDVAVGYIGHTGAIRWDRATLGVFELEAVAARVREVHAAVETARASAVRDYSTGYHCRRCPAMSMCPAQVAIVRAWSSSAAGVETSELVAAYPKLTDEEAGAAWERLAVLGEMLDAARAALRARAEIKGLPLSGGAVLMPVEVPRRSVVMDRAMPVLRARFGAQADEAVDRSMTAESIARLARQLAPGKGQKKAVDALWSELREAGGVRDSSFVQLRVKKAKPAKGAAEEGVES